MTNPYNYILKNNRIIHQSTLSFPFNDCGFLYGYGLYETIRIHNKKPILLEKHIQRIKSAATVLSIAIPDSLNTFKDTITALITKNDVTHATCNIYLTAGDKPAETHLNEPLLLGLLRPLKTEQTPISLATRQESFKRMQLDSFKTLSRLKNTLEHKFIAPYHDVLLYDHNKTILETPIANVFFVKENRLITPKANQILRGVIRDYLIENQQKFNISITEKNITLNDISKCDEIFTTNALKGIQLIQETENIPHLKSGIITHSLKNKLEKELYT